MLSNTESTLLWMDDKAKLSLSQDPGYPKIQAFKIMDNTSLNRSDI